jgi:predicted transcriptional regulator
MTQTETMQITRGQRQHTLDAAVRHLLWRWRDEGPVWTSNIAAALNQPTKRVYESLLRLAEIGHVVRVDDGNPSSWMHRL